MKSARNLLLASLLVSFGLAAQDNVNAPDAPAGGVGADVTAASNAGGSTDKVFNFTPSGDDQSYTVIIKNSAGTVVDEYFVPSGSCPPMTIPAGGKAYIHDADSASPDDGKNVTGHATMT